MTAAERAVRIANLVDLDPQIQSTISQKPDISEIPLTAAQASFGLVINLPVAAEKISLTLIWDLTVVLIRTLNASGELREFEIAGVRIIATEPPEGYQRVVSVESSVDNISKLRVNQMRDLLNPAFDGDAYHCYWYADKELIPEHSVMGCPDERRTIDSFFRRVVSG